MEKATHCLCRVRSVVAETWKREGRIGKSRLIPKVSVLHCEAVGSATKLTTMIEFTGDAMGREVVDQQFYSVDEDQNGGSAMCVRVLLRDNGSKRQPDQRTR